MRSVRRQLAAVLLAGLCPVCVGVSAALPDVHGLSLSRLEQRLVEIDTELETLASFSMRSGVGPVGYRSRAHSNNIPEWIQVDLNGVSPIDQVVLVPSIWRDTRAGFRADGFPREFTVTAGTAADTNGTRIAAYTEADPLLPRIAPLAVPCNVTASWVRVTATSLSRRAWDGMHNLQLAEIMIFNGEDNVALGQKVTSSSQGQGEGNSRKARFAVDGFVPYLMDASQGQQSIAFVSGLGIGDHPALTVDLGAVHSIDRIHLHGADLSDTIPHSTPADFGIPKRLIVQAANQPDFSDAIDVVEFAQDSIFEVGPIIIRRFPPAACRYVRLVVLDPYIGSEPTGSGSQIGFAEIEIFAAGHNVARGKSFIANFRPQTPDRTTAALTDGMNLYGQILPIRDWLQELARRHDLEAERPLVAGELSVRYARQKANLRRLRWLAALLAAGIVFTYLVDRIVRLRQAARIRERFAADLHDELGANLHAIGLLGDLAKDALDSPDELVETVDEIRAITERTSAAARFCTAMHTADGLFGSLPEDMHRAATRILADIPYDISIEGETYFNKLKPRTRTDLFLFYKESLVNISRHANASRVLTELVADRNRITLTVTDNGGGIEAIPPSLKRRARLLGAHVAVETPATGGTRITLILEPRRWRLA